MLLFARRLGLAVSLLLASPVLAQTSGSNPADRDLAPGAGTWKGQVRHPRPTVWSTDASKGTPTNASKKYGGLKAPDFKGETDPRLAEVYNDQLKITERFNRDLNQAIKDAGINASVESGTKTPKSILGKMQRKADEGKEYPLGKLTDLSRGRINVDSNNLEEVAAIDRALRQKYGLPPNDKDNPNFLQDFKNAADPKSGYARSHLIIKDKDGNAYELQIGSRDLTKFIDAPLGSTNVHDAIYKGKDLGLNLPPELKGQYDKILVDISKNNAKGKSIADDAELSTRIEKFKQDVKGALPPELQKDPPPKDEPPDYRMPGSVTLISVATQGAVGIDKGPFKDGRWTWAEGQYGRIGMDVLRADGSASAKAGITKEGVRGDFVAQGQATLVGISGETARFGVGDPNGLNQAGVQADGRAFVGADGQAVTSVAVGKGGVKAVGNINAFVGAKAKTQIVGSASLCGLQVTGTGTGEASAGLGAGASGVFQVDWATGKIKVGGQADLTVGLGAGAGGQVEISVEKIIRDPKAAGKCVVDGIKGAGTAIANGAEQAAGWLAGTWRSLVGGKKSDIGNAVATLPLGPTPYNAMIVNGAEVGRYAPTQVVASGATEDDYKAGRAVAAGFRR